MAGKRANGEGSYYQLKDRTWVYQVTIGRKEDGSPLRKSFKGRTKAICKQRKEEWDMAQATIQDRVARERLEAENVEALAARLGHFPEAKTPFKDAFLEWLKLYSPPESHPPMPATWLPTRPILSRRLGKCPCMQSPRTWCRPTTRRSSVSGAGRIRRTAAFRPRPSATTT